MTSSKIRDLAQKTRNDNGRTRNTHQVCDAFRWSFTQNGFTSCTCHSRTTNTKGNTGNIAGFMPKNDGRWTNNSMCSCVTSKKKQVICGICAKNHSRSPTEIVVTTQWHVFGYPYATGTQDVRKGAKHLHARAMGRAGTVPQVRASNGSKQGVQRARVWVSLVPVQHITIAASHRLRISVARCVPPSRQKNRGAFNNPWACKTHRLKQTLMSPQRAGIAQRPRCPSTRVARLRTKNVFLHRVEANNFFQNDAGR